MENEINKIYRFALNEGGYQFSRGFFGTQNDAELMKKSTNPYFLHFPHFSLLRLADNKLESYNNI